MDITAVLVVVPVSLELHLSFEISLLPMARQRVQDVGAPGISITGTEGIF